MFDIAIQETMHKKVHVWWLISTGKRNNAPKK